MTNKQRINSRWVGNLIRCGRCDETKETNEFYRNRSRPDGYAGFCKVCENQYAPRSKTGKGQTKKNKGRQIKKDRPTKKNKLEWCFKKHKKSAKLRGKEFSLTQEDVYSLISKPCFYCGEFSSAEGINGIDRVNSDLGYEANNCVPCCSMCNHMKFTYHQDAFILKVKKIAKHLT